MIYNTARRYFISASGSGYAIAANTAPLTFSTTNANYVWQLETGNTAGTYHIKNVGTSTYSAGGTTLGGTATDYTIAEFSTCPSKGGMASYNDDGTTTAAESITSANNAVYIVAYGTTEYWNGTDAQFQTTAKGHVYVLYEISEEYDPTTIVTIINKDYAATTYGSLAGTTFTTNAASGMAGVTINGIIGTTATNFAYGACLSLTSTASGTVTMTAPDGYIITAYSLTARSNTYAVPYTLTPSKGGSSVTTNTTGVTLNASNLTEQTASFTYSAASANSFYIPSMTITVMDASTTTINVTYELYESDGTTFVASVVKLQEPNSDISIPSSLQNTTYFNYATEGTIGEEDCTIKVTRTLKNASIVYPISNLSNAKAYTLTTQRGSLGTNGTQMVSTNGTTHSASNFAIISYEGNYYLYSVADSKWVGNPKTINSIENQPELTDDLANVTALTFDLTSAPLYFMGMGSNGVNVSNYSTGIVVNSWTTRDEGNQYVIEEAADFDPTDALAALDEYFHPSYRVTYVVKDTEGTTLFTSDPVGTTLGANITTLPAEYQQALFYDYNTVDVTISETHTVVNFTATPKTSPLFQYTSDTTSPVYYVLKLKNANYPTYVADGTPNVTLPTTISDDYDKVIWAFVGEPYAGFQIINRAAGSELVLGSATVSATNNGGNTYATLATAGTQEKERWNVVSSTYATNGFYLFNDEGYALNQRSTANLAYWTGGYDLGSTFTVEAIDDIYDNVIAQLEAIDYAVGLGHYGFTGEYAGYTSQASTIISGLRAQGYSAYNLAIAKELLASTAYNAPTGMFVRIKSTHSTYLSGTESTESAGRLSFTDATDASTIFYYDGTYLYDLANGRAAAGRAVGAAGSTGLAYTFEESTISVGTGKYAIRFNPDGSTKRFLYAWNDTGKHYADQNGSDHANCVFTLEQVTDLPLTISEAGYATLYTPVALTIPTGVTAYTGYIDGSALKLEALSEKIPAETAVILQGEAGNYTFTTTTADTFDSDNNLEGTIGGKASTADAILTLQNYNDKIGLFNYTGATLQGFKAYLDKTNLESNVHGLTFEFDTETAIQGISLDEQSGAIYNLAGQRVQKATKGLYIVNGKKVLVK